jgi:hypothetical protein
MDRLRPGHFGDRGRGKYQSYARDLTDRLRGRRERPAHRSPAEKGDELAPPHYSMTSSARASSMGGTSMTERVRGLKVDDQLVLGRLLDR